MYSFYVYLTVIAACLIAVIYNRKYFPSYYRLFILLLFCVLIIEGTLLTGNKELLILTHDFNPVIEFSLMGLIYRKVLRSSVVKRLILIAIIIQICAFVVNALLLGISANNVLFTLLSHCFVLFLSLCYVYESFQPPFLGKKIYTDTFFWINSANLLFYAGTFLFMTIREEGQILTDDDKDILVFIGRGLNISLYSIYLIGFTCPRNLE